MTNLWYEEAFRDYARIVVPMELESNRWAKVEPSNIMRTAEAQQRIDEIVHRLIEIETAIARYSEGGDESDSLVTPDSDYHDLWSNMDPTEAARAFRACAIVVVRQSSCPLLATTNTHTNWTVWRSP